MLYYLFAMLCFGIAFQRARAIGRSGFLWGSIAAGTFVLTGWIVAFCLEIVLAIGAEFWDWDSDTLDYIRIVGLILAWIASFLSANRVLSYLLKPTRLSSEVEQP